MLSKRNRGKNIDSWKKRLVKAFFCKNKPFIRNQARSNSEGVDGCLPVFPIVISYTAHIDKSDCFQSHLL